MVETIAKNRKLLLDAEDTARNAEGKLSKVEADLKVEKEQLLTIRAKYAEVSRELAEAKKSRDSTQSKLREQTWELNKMKEEREKLARVHQRTRMAGLRTVVTSPPVTMMR